MKSISGLFLPLALLLSAVTPAQAVTIAESQISNNVATEGIYYVGQSFTVAGAGSFNNIAFNFYNAAGAPSAPGTLFLYSSAYSGTVTALGSAAANLLGSASGAGGFYTFAPSLALSGGSQYFAYANAASPIFQFSTTDVYAGGTASQADSSVSSFAVLPPDLRFQVTGTQLSAAVPEAASWAMMLVGFAAIGGALRSRKRAKIAFAV